MIEFRFHHLDIPVVPLSKSYFTHKREAFSNRINKMWSDQTISRQNKRTKSKTRKLVFTPVHDRAARYVRHTSVPCTRSLWNEKKNQSPETLYLYPEPTPFGPSVYYWCSLIIKLCLTVAFRCRPARCENNQTKQYFSQNRMVVPRWRLRSGPCDHILWEGRPVRWKMFHFDNWRSYEACYHWWSGTRCSIFIPGAWISK